MPLKKPFIGGDQQEIEGRGRRGKKSVGGIPVRRLDGVEGSHDRMREWCLGHRDEPCCFIDPRHEAAGQLDPSPVDQQRQLPQRNGRQPQLGGFRLKLGC